MTPPEGSGSESDPPPGAQEPPGPGVPSAFRRAAARSPAGWIVVALIAVGAVAIAAGTAGQVSGVVGGTVTGALAAASAGTALAFVLLRPASGIARLAVAVAATGGSLAGVVGSRATGSGPVAAVTIEAGAATALAFAYALILRPRADPDPPEPTQIFISYCHDDLAWIGRVLLHLQHFENTGQLKVWSDLQLKGGDAWQAEILRSLGRAQAAVLLVTPAYLASDFVNKQELPPLLRAEETGDCRIIPVLVKPSTFEWTKLARFHAHNSPNRPLVAMTDEEADECLARLARDLLPPPPGPSRS